MTERPGARSPRRAQSFIAVIAASWVVLGGLAVSGHAQSTEPVLPGERDPLRAEESLHPSEPDTSWAGRWMDQPAMFGDWLGLRPALARFGIEPNVTWVTNVQGNVIGGERQRLREFDNLLVEVNVNLEKLMGAPGTTFYLSLSQRSGTSLSNEDIGNVFNVAQVCCGPAFRLVDVYLEQPLFGGRLDVRGGRLAAGDEFLASPLYGFFVQSGINGNPAGILFNAPGMTTYPVATWGLRVRAEPIPDAYAMVGAFNGDPTLGENAKHGADWSMRGPLLTIAEVGYRAKLGDGDRGLPGNYKIGGYYNGGTHEDFLRDVDGGLVPETGLAPRTARGKTGFYVAADQMVYREGGEASEQGLTPFVALVGAPDESINQMPFFVTGGLVYRGLIPRRDDDVTAFGVVYGRFSSDLRRAQQLERQAGSAVGVQDYELVFEWTHVIQVARWLAVQPDVQYIVKPGGTGAIPNALVLGVQIAVAF